MNKTVYHIVILLFLLVLASITIAIIYNGYKYRNKTEEVVQYDYFVDDFFKVYVAQDTVTLKGLIDDQFITCIEEEVELVDQPSAHNEYNRRIPEEFEALQPLDQALAILNLLIGEDGKSGLVRFNSKGNISVHPWGFAINIEVTLLNQTKTEIAFQFNVKNEVITLACVKGYHKAIEGLGKM